MVDSGGGIKGLASVHMNKAERVFRRAVYCTTTSNNPCFGMFHVSITSLNKHALLCCGFIQIIEKETCVFSGRRKVPLWKTLSGAMTCLGGFGANSLAYMMKRSRD